MKRNIEVINMDASLINYINNYLDIAPNEIKSSRELKYALESLMGKINEEVILEYDGKVVDSKNKLEAGGLSVYINQRRVLRDNVEITLTPKEFDILLFLIKNKGEVFTKEQIYQAVWEESYLMDDSNIMAFIRKLRKKIEPNPDNPIYILTLWGIGYKFNDQI